MCQVVSLGHNNYRLYHKICIAKFVTVSELVYQDIEVFVLFLSERSLTGEVMSLLEFYSHHEGTKNTSENTKYSSCYLEIIFHVRETYLQIY